MSSGRDVVRLRALGPNDASALIIGGVLLGAAAFAGLVSVASAPEAARLGAVGLFGVPAVLVLAITVPRALRPLALAPDELRIPRVVRTTRIPVADIAGVGLLYRAPAGTGERHFYGWTLTIWTTDGARQVVERFSVGVEAALTGADPPGPSRRTAPPSAWAVPFEHRPGDLARTRAGRAARAIHDYVTARQGATGPLATMALQAHERADRWADPLVLAYFDPNGTLARVT